MRITKSKSGKRIELRRYIVNTDTGAGSTDYIGSFPEPSYYRGPIIADVTIDLWERLTEDEKAQLQDWFDVHAEHEEMRFRENVIKGAWCDLKNIARAIRETEGEFSIDRAGEILEGMQEIKKELRAKGYTLNMFRPAAQADDKDPNQISFLEEEE